MLNVVSIAPDCDNDTPLVLATSSGRIRQPKVPVAAFGDAGHQWLFLHVRRLLAERKPIRQLTRYETVRRGTKRIAQKLAKKVSSRRRTVNDRVEPTNEAPDLMHPLVLLQDQISTLTTVIHTIFATAKPGTPGF